MKDGYFDAFDKADKVYWLPTYLTRENPSLPVLTPEELIAGLKESDKAEVADTDDELFAKILAERDAGRLVVLMTAGPADEWLRKKLA